MWSSPPWSHDLLPPLPWSDQAPWSVLFPWPMLQILVQQILHEWEMIMVTDSQKTGVQWLYVRTFLCGQKPQGEMGLLASSAQFFNNNIK